MAYAFLSNEPQSIAELAERAKGHLSPRALVGTLERLRQQGKADRIDTGGEPKFRRAPRKPVSRKEP